jgi:leader peptidase (prepilin peptidase)/N-methyltransferase
MRFGPGLSYLFFLAFTTSLLVISFIDLQHQIIPDVISIPGILLGFAGSLWVLPISWIDSLIGILVGGGSFYLIAVFFSKIRGREGMGGGDIKLLAMIGAWMGWKGLPFIILIASLTGLALGGVSLLMSRRGLQARIPFGPFLSLGALVFLFFGQEIVSAYYGFMFRG